MLMPAAEATLPSSTSWDELLAGSTQTVPPSSKGPIVWGSVEFPWLPSKAPLDMESSMASLTTQADSELAAGLSLDSLTSDLNSLTEQASPSELALLHSEALPEIIRVVGRGMDSGGAIFEGTTPTAEVYRAGSPGPCAVIPDMDPDVYERLLLLALYGEGATADALNRKPDLMERFGEDLARRVIGELRPVPLQKAMNRYDKAQTGRFPCSNFKRMLRNDMRIPPASVSDSEIEAMLFALDNENVGTFSIAEFVDFMELYSPKRSASRSPVPRPPSAGPGGRSPRADAEAPGGAGSHACGSFRRHPRTSHKAPLRTRSKEPQSVPSSASSADDGVPVNTVKKTAKPKSRARKLKKPAASPPADDESVQDGAAEGGKRTEDQLKPVKKPAAARGTKERRQSIASEARDIKAEDTRGDDFADDIWNPDGANRLDAGRGVLFFPPVPYLVNIPLNGRDASKKARDTTSEEVDDEFFIVPASTTTRMSAGQPAYAGLKETTSSLLPALISTPRGAQQRSLKSKHSNAWSEHYMPRSARGPGRFSSFQVAN
mmetsp:Transcript_35969/g.66078  ORF Transcript_35969/g.66078 Transcript_35969/m.66078 type:complete len:547 (+) Transcript_35969:50-1690(+)